MSSVSFSGLASGIDGDAIIEATIESRRITKKPLENKIEQNNTEVQAVDKLREKTNSLADTLRTFTSFSGTGVSKSVVSSNESLVSAAVSDKATPGTISMSVEQLAKASRITFDQTYESLDSLVAPDLEEPGVMTIKIGSGDASEEVDINVDDKTTLNDIAIRISDALPDKVSSSVVNVGTETTPQYKLMISGIETGIDKGSLEISLDSNLSGNNIFDSYQNSQAQDAIVNIDGIGTISRGKNVINDIVPGLSVDLKETTIAPVTIRIANDLDSTSKRVSEFVGKFNEIIRFVNEESKITRVEDENGVRNEFGSLARTRVDRQLVSSLRNAISSTSLSEGDVRIFADLGITTDRKTGELVFDKETFESALSENGKDVTSILQSFSDKVSSTGGIISSFTNFNGIFDQQKKSKQNVNESISRRLQKIEVNIERQREFLKKMFARLEETVGQLNSNASALSGILPQQNNK